EDGIRDKLVTGVQTCALPICAGWDADRDAFHNTTRVNSSVIPSVVEESLTVSEIFRDVSTSVDMTKAIRENEWISRELLRAFERSEERRVGKKGKFRVDAYK